MSKSNQTLSCTNHNAKALGPVVLICEHASNRLPFEPPLNYAERRILRSHWGWDIGTWDVSRELARRLETTATAGRWSRLVIDLNRRVDDRTLIREEAEGVVLGFNRNLSVAEIERRILRYHTPFHNEVDRQIVRRIVRGIRPLVLAIHSFTPVYGDEYRPFEIGVLYDQHGALGRKVGQAIGATGLKVRFNEPYSGIKGLMYAADRHGSHFNLPCLELEINQKFFDSKLAARRLAKVLADALAVIGGTAGVAGSDRGR